MTDITPTELDTLERLAKEANANCWCNSCSPNYFSAVGPQTLLALVAAARRGSPAVPVAVSSVLEQVLLFAGSNEHYREPHRNSLIFYGTKHHDEIRRFLDALSAAPSKDAREPPHCPSCDCGAK